MTQPNAITEYDPIVAALASIERFRGLVVDVTTAQGMAEAKAAHREVAAPRIALEKTRKKLKEDVLERGRAIDGEAKRIATQIAEIEDPLKAQIDAEERRAEEARQAAIRAEQDRLAAEEAAKKKAEEDRLAAERAELARQRAALEAEQRASRERIEAEERAARAAREEADREARKAREAEEARLKAERDALDAERRAKEEAERRAQAEADAKARAEQEAKEAVERERRRKINELADARTMLELFKVRFGHLPEYADVVRAIDECLEPA